MVTRKKTVKKKAVVKKAAAKKAAPAKKPVKKKAVAKKPVKKKAVAKKPVAKKKTVAAKKKMAAPKVIKKKITKKAAPKKKTTAKKTSVKPAKVSAAAAKKARQATYQAMKRAKRMADKVREDDVYGGGASFAALRGHPTAESEAQLAQHSPSHQMHDDRARIEQLVAKNVQGHISAQGRRRQGLRDHR